MEKSEEKDRAVIAGSPDRDFSARCSDDIYWRSVFAADYAEELRSVLSGMNTDLGKIIADKDGRADGEKINALVVDMLGCYGRELEKENKALEGWQSDMYSAFLYCAMIFYSERRNGYDATNLRIELPLTFKDILNTAGHAVDEENKPASFEKFLEKACEAFRKPDPKDGGKLISPFCETARRCLFMLGFDRHPDAINIFHRPNDSRMEKSAKCKMALDSVKSAKKITNYYEFANYKNSPWDKFLAIKARHDKVYAKSVPELKNCSESTIYAVRSAFCFAQKFNSWQGWARYASGIDKNILRKCLADFLELYYGHENDSFYFEIERIIFAYLKDKHLCPMDYLEYYALVTQELQPAMRRINEQVSRVAREYENKIWPEEE